VSRDREMALSGPPNCVNPAVDSHDRDHVGVAASRRCRQPVGRGGQAAPVQPGNRLGDHRKTRPEGVRAEDAVSQMAIFVIIGSTAEQRDVWAQRVVVLVGPPHVGVAPDRCGKRRTRIDAAAREDPFTLLRVAVSDPMRSGRAESS
jgi:hypothetical protein